MKTKVFAGLAIGSLLLSGGMAFAAAPSIFLSPTSLAFGNQQVATFSNEQQVFAQNNGDAPLVITGVTLTGVSANQFSIGLDACSGATLNPSSFCTVNVAFAPSTTGAKNAALSFSSNAAGSPHAVTLSGTGVNPSVFISPSTLNFGNQQIGTVGAAQQIFVQNNGSGNGPVTVGSLSFSGTHATDYVKTSDGCSGAILQPSGFCTITVAFAPTAAGARSAALNIPTNVPGSPQTVPLSGNGVNASLFISPSSLSFGNVQLGSSSSPMQVFVQNDGAGNGPVSIGIVTVTGANPSDFTKGADGCSGATLQAAQFCSIEVSFAPSAAGPRSATLQIPSSIPAGSSMVPLSGTGVSAISVSPPLVSFGNVRVGTTSFSQFVSVSNGGATPVSIGNVHLSGSNPGDFAIVADSCNGMTLAPFGFCSVEITFAPTVIGPRSGSLVITTPLPDSPHSSVLSGTGTAPVISITPGSLTFPSTELGQASAPMTAIVRNTGNANGLISGAGFSGGASQFNMVSDGCSGAALPPGGSCSVQISFVPGKLGASDPTTFTVASDAPTVSIPLQGTGIDTTAPVTTWTTASPSVRVSLLQSVDGVSTDAGGVQSVLVSFVDILGSTTIAPAVLTGCTSGSKSCTWNLTVPLLIPGVYTVGARATDKSGNSETPGPQITIVVI